MGKSRQRREKQALLAMTKREARRSRRHAHPRHAMHEPEEAEVGINADDDLALVMRLEAELLRLKGAVSVILALQDRLDRQLDTLDRQVDALDARIEELVNDGIAAQERAERIL